jgi:D-glycero-D-manno-heptose 1,7-bisphosphate phosphatase
MKNRAIFLDRDGVINHDPGDYTKHISEFQILPTVMESLQIVQKRGFIIVIITNQGGLAKGLYTWDDVHEIHDYLKKECGENGVKISGVFAAPYHDDFGRSLTRKPDSLMLEKACALYNIDPEKSYMIGDKQRDIDAGNKVGAKGVLIPTNAALLDYVHLLV